MRPWIALMVVLASGPACERNGDKQPELDVLGQVPAFQLTDQTGAQVSDQDLRGAITVINFIFTRCPTVCPVTSMKMQRVGGKLADLGGRAALVSISVDPEHDTPEVLGEFASRYKADPSRWRFLTGPPELIRSAVENGFKIALERKGQLEGGVPDIVHGVHFVLVDDQLRIRGYYDSDSAERLDQLVRDARQLAADLD